MYEFVVTDYTLKEFFEKEIKKCLSHYLSKYYRQQTQININYHYCKCQGKIIGNLVRNFKIEPFIINFNKGFQTNQLSKYIVNKEYISTNSFKKNIL